MEPELLGEQVLSSSPSGTFKRVKRWYRGKRPELKGIYTIGLSGDWETIVEIDCIKATGKFTVEEST